MNIFFLTIVQVLLAALILAQYGKTFSESVDAEFLQASNAFSLDIYTVIANMFRNL